MKTTQEILKDVANLDEVPSDYDLLAINFFYIVKNLLALYNLGKLTKEQAGNMKQKAIHEYEMSRQIYRYKAWDNVSTELLRTTLRKDINAKNIEAALTVAVELVEYYSGEKFD